MEGFTGFTLDVYVHSAPSSSIPSPPMVYLYHSINETFVKKMSVHVQSKTCSKSPTENDTGSDTEWTEMGPVRDTFWSVTRIHSQREFL